MSTIETGVLVRLKSGGPQMVVESVDSIPLSDAETVAHIVSCHWFDNDEKLQKGEFDLRELIADEK